MLVATKKKLARLRPKPMLVCTCGARIDTTDQKGAASALSHVECALNGGPVVLVRRSNVITVSYYSPIAVMTGAVAKKELNRRYGKKAVRR